MSSAPPAFLDPKQGAEYLSISLRAFRRLMSSGAFPVVRISARTQRVRQDDLDAFLERMTVRETPGRNR